MACRLHAAIKSVNQVRMRGLRFHGRGSVSLTRGASAFAKEELLQARRRAKYHVR